MLTPTSLTTAPAWRWTGVRLLCLSALFILLTGNLTFAEQVLAIYPWPANAGFLVSLFVLHLALLVFALGLGGMVLPIRWLVSLALVVAAVSGYYIDGYGTVIDDNMIRNLAETNVGEAADLLSLSFFGRLALLGALPLALVWRLPLQRRSWWRERLIAAAAGAAGLAVMALVLAGFGDQYASLFREHKAIRYYTNPLYPIYSTVKYLGQRSASHAPRTFQTLSEDAAVPASDREHELIVLVVGETARAGNFSLNGYPRQTNPRLAADPDVISYSNFTSCGTSTAISVPCMFSFAPREAFDVDAAPYQQNVLDVLRQAGVSVLWRDNNSDSKGVALRVDYQDFRSAPTNPVCDAECRDEGMLAGLQEYVDGHPGDVLIVLHQMGSHGPAYYKRYPADFERFQPACHSLELAECSEQEIVNAYDNTILYTDYFLSRVIAFLKQNGAGRETAMLYLSDHGESLGGGGLYLHGIPYAIAPQEQVRVPFIAWVGPDSDLDPASMRRLADAELSHDSLARALLEAFEVEPDAPLRAKLEGVPALFERRAEPPALAEGGGVR